MRLSLTLSGFKGFIVYIYTYMTNYSVDLAIYTVYLVERNTKNINLWTILTLYGNLPWYLEIIHWIFILLLLYYFGQFILIFQVYWLGINNPYKDAFKQISSRFNHISREKCFLCETIKILIYKIRQSCVTTILFVINNWQPFSIIVQPIFERHELDLKWSIT